MEEWYEFFISDVNKILKQESRRLSELRKKKVYELYESLQTSVSCPEINRIKSELDNYYETEKKGLEKRLCHERKFLFQSTKVLIEKEKKTCESEYIRKI